MMIADAVIGWFSDFSEWLAGQVGTYLPDLDLDGFSYTITGLDEGVATANLFFDVERIGEAFAFVVVMEAAYVAVKLVLKVRHVLLP